MEWKGIEWNFFGWRWMEEFVGYGPEAPLPRQKSSNQLTWFPSSALVIQQTNGNQPEREDQPSPQWMNKERKKID